ncbi:MAG: adenine deaminase, partial [Bacteroidia bacterium]
MFTTTIKANLIDIFQRKTYPVCITIQDGRIKTIDEITDWQEVYILPGFVDAHVHIESSML